MQWIRTLRRRGAQAGWLALALMTLAPAAALATTAAPPPAAAVEQVVVATDAVGPITAQQLEAAVQVLVPPKEQQLFWGSKDSATRFLRSMGAQRSLAARAERSGLTPPDPAATGLQREQALLKLYLTQQGEAVVPDEAALQRYAQSEYRARPDHFVAPAQVRVRHILLAPGQGADEAAVKARADKLLAELRGGADFAALAQAESADEGSAGRGGELPWFPRGVMVAEFEAAAFAQQQPGLLSEPVKTSFGYHIIELLETRAERQLSFEEVLPTLQAQAQARLSEAERARLWEEAREQVRIDEAALEPLLYRKAAEAAKR